MPNTTTATVGPVPVRWVAAALRRRLGPLHPARLAELLYLAQGHHVATFDRPLFGEPLRLTPGGLSVDGPTGAAGEIGDHPEMGEAELNTIGYVASRYGHLNDIVLTHTVTGTDPWQRAAATARHLDLIPLTWITEYFTALDRAESAALFGTDPGTVLRALGHTS